jgi:hypothetical protein
VVDGVGTSDAFKPPVMIAVKAKDFHGNARCDLELRDVATETVVDIGEQTSRETAWPYNHRVGRWYTSWTTRAAYRSPRASEDGLTRLLYKERKLEISADARSRRGNHRIPGAAYNDKQTKTQRRNKIAEQAERPTGSFVEHWQADRRPGHRL